MTIGLGADPAVRADFPPSGRTDSLALLGFDTTRRISELLQRLGQVLGQVPAQPPRVPLAVPLTDVAGHEASRNPGGGPADSHPQAVHAGLRMVDAPPFVGPPGTKIPMESVKPGKAPEVVLGGLESPTGLTIRNKVAYISDCGTCAGKGRVLRVPL